MALANDLEADSDTSIEPEIEEDYFIDLEAEQQD